MTLEQIANLQVDESTIGTLLERLLDYSLLSVSDKPYILDEDTNLPFYQRVIVHTKFSKPTEAQLEAELDLYKADLAAIEQARLNELARIADIESRFHAIKNIHGVFAELNLNIPNSALEMKRIIKENDQIFLTQLESAWQSTVEVKYNKSVERETTLKVGRAVRDLSDRVLSLITGYNYSRSLTSEQINVLKTTFSKINELLKDGQPFHAKPLIQAITPDGVLVTEEIKQAILEEYNLTI